MSWYTIKTLHPLEYHRCICDSVKKNSIVKLGTYQQFWSTLFGKLKAYDH